MHGGRLHATRIKKKTSTTLEIGGQHNYIGESILYRREIGSTQQITSPFFITP